MIIDRTVEPWQGMPPPVCSGCGERITETQHVFWMLHGDPSGAELHARCAARLSLHLASDALKLARALKIYDLGHPDTFYRRKE